MNHPKSKICRHGTFTSLFIALLALAFGHQGAAKPPETLDVLIRFGNQPGAREAEIVKRHGGVVRRTFHLVPAVAATVPSAAVERIRKEPGVVTVEPDGTFEAHDLDNTWGVRRIGCGPVHSGSGTGITAPQWGTGVRVAIVDTGIDYSHGELLWNYLGGYDFVNNDSNPMDDHGHGTHVAGTVAAVRDGSGVVGASPEADLYALKVLGANGSGSYSGVIAALQWCVDHGISVANFSLGSSGHPGSTTEMAFRNADAAGVVLVASAGNSGAGTNTVGYPARFASVIAVASTTSSDLRSSFSSTGPDVELAAPGSSIYSTLLGGGYGFKSGTSMAAPHVAGVAALVIGSGVNDANGNGKINDEVRGVLVMTAEDLGAAGFDNEFGYGLVDAEFAVATAEDPDWDGPTDPRPVFNAPANLTGSVDGSLVTLSWDDKSNVEDGFQVQYGVKEKNKVAWQDWTLVNADETGHAGIMGDGTIHFRVRAFRDDPESQTEWSNTIQLSVGNSGPGEKRGRK